MSLFQVSFKSKVLVKKVQMNVIIPEDFNSNEYHPLNKNVKFKTLFLYHGGSGDYTEWLRYSSIERYARKYNLAVVMPDADFSYYTDMAHGRKYWTFISEEVPDYVRFHFPLSEKREDNYVAGMSMGGYGSFKMALQKPEMFKAAISLSGALCVEEMYKYSHLTHEMLNDIFGSIDNIQGTENDLKYLLTKLKDNDRKIPKLYQFCGTEDFLYSVNQKFRNYAEKLNVDLYYEEGPGKHDWDYWDMTIQKALELLFK